MRIAICDDTTADADEIETFCTNSSFNNGFEITRFTSGLKLLELVQKKKKRYDVIFLDVNMPKKSGIEIGVSIRRLDPDVFLVFVTHHPQYAIAAFECQAFHYLIKPLTQGRVDDVLDKIMAKGSLKNHYHVITVRGKKIRINLSDLFFVECCRKHVIYHMRDRDYDTVGNLSDAYDALKDWGILQIHQGYLVNMEKIIDFKGNDLILEDNRTVPISIRKRKEVFQAYAKYIERYV